MEWLIPVVGVLATAASGAITVWVARRKGLPKLNKEIEERSAVLITTMKEQLDAADRKVESLALDFNGCKDHLTQALLENESLIRRLRLAEADLLTLFRGQHKRPPRRLTHPDEAT